MGLQGARMVVAAVHFAHPSPSAPLPTPISLSTFHAPICRSSHLMPMLPGRLLRDLCNLAPRHRIHKAHGHRLGSYSGWAALALCAAAHRKRIATCPLIQLVLCPQADLPPIPSRDRGMIFLADESVDRVVVSALRAGIAPSSTPRSRKTGS
jgi:hypothetical protein